MSIDTFMFEFNTTGIARPAAEAGAEFAIVDMEHTGWAVETIRMLIATCGSTPILPIIRIPATEYHFIARVLDMGAAGIMVPMVESAAQAQEFVESAKYPPLSRHGAGFTISHDNFTGGEIVEKIRTANSETLLISQIVNPMSHFTLDKAPSEVTIDYHACRSSIYRKHDEGFTISIHSRLGRRCRRPGTRGRARSHAGAAGVLRKEGATVIRKALLSVP